MLPRLNSDTKFNKSRNRCSRLRDTLEPRCTIDNIKSSSSLQNYIISIIICFSVFAALPEVII